MLAVEWAERLCDSCEAVEVSSITREEEPALGTYDGPRRPKHHAVVAEAALAPMLRGQAMDPHSFVLGERTPVELLDVGDTVLAKQCGVLERHEEARPRISPRQGNQRRQIHVVIVIVGDHDEIDLRQIREGDSWRDEAFGPGKRHRARRLGPNRVGEEGDVIHLHEHGRVADPRDGRLTVLCVLAEERAVVCDDGGSTGSVAERAADPPPEKWKTRRQAAMRKLACEVGKAAVTVTRGGPEIHSWRLTGYRSHQTEAGEPRRTSEKLVRSSHLRSSLGQRSQER